MNKRSRIKAGLSFGITMSVFFILQSLWKYDQLTTKNIITSIVSGLFGGALSGLLFGWLIGLFAKSKVITQGTTIDTAADEVIVFETPANHFKGVEGVGGKLYLTNKRLVFKSHKFNIQNHQISLNLSNIEMVNRYNTLGLVDNGLAVTSNNRVEKFVVEQREEWISQLTKKSGLQQVHLQ